MTAGRGDRTARPARHGHWEVRFADAASAKGRGEGGLIALAPQPQSHCSPCIASFSKIGRVNMVLGKTCSAPAARSAPTVARTSISRNFASYSCCATVFPHR